MNKNIIKLIGLAATGLGCVATFICEMAHVKEIEQLVDEKVNEKFEALTNEETKEDEEELQNEGEER